MTSIQIKELLEKIQKKVEVNGYEIPYFRGIEKDGKVKFGVKGEVRAYIKICDEELVDRLIYSILFSHDFAKALWGDEPCCSACGMSETIRQKGRENWKPGQPSPFSGCIWCDNGYDSVNWKYELQQMVLVENPLEYLESHI